MFAQLGSYVFERLIGPTTYELSGSERYAEHPLINLQPRLDHTGTELRVLKFDILYHADFCVPEFEIAGLWAAKNTATILPFILGNGRVIGDFVIADITEVVNHTLEDGTYVQAQVSVTLKECIIQDKEAQKEKESKADATGLKSNNPTALRGYPKQYTTLANDLAMEAARAQALAAGLDNDMLELTNLEKLEMITEWVVDKLDKLGNALDLASSIINGSYIDALTLAAPYVDWITDNADIMTNIGICATAVDNISTLMPITSFNITNVINANTYLQGAMGQYQLSLANTIIQTGTRKI